MDKLKFRHWVEAVENNLEYMHGWDRSSEILDRVRGQEVDITEEKLANITDMAQEAIDEDGETAFDRSAYNFGPASRMLYTFLLGKINTDICTNARPQSTRRMG